MSTKLHLYLSKTGEEPHIVFRAAVASRLLILTLIVFWRMLLSPYDTSATLNPKCLCTHSNNTPPPENILWPWIGSAIEGSIVWDAVYFVRIAQCGYEYEQSYAFLPLLPICLSILSRTIFAPLVPIIGYRAVLGLSGYVIDNIAFVFAALYFYRLSLLILKDSRAALRASLLFCLNPASIFYSSVYSESLYSLFSFGGIYHLLSGANTVAVLELALSGSARSNGVLNAGYFCFQTMHQIFDAIFQKKRVGLAVQSLVAGAMRTVFIFLPFLGFQAYGYYNICLENSSVEMSPWCKARVPLLYNYLQSHYWGIGFLRYFQFKQLPNFLLASPILSLAICSIVHYMKLRREIVFSLGFLATDEEKKHAVVLYSFSNSRKPNNDKFCNKEVSANMSRDNKLKQRKHVRKDKDSGSIQDPKMSSNDEVKTGYSSILILPFVLHLGFMAATAFLVMHVQVATRFLSASPPLYWFSSYVMVSPGISRKWGYLIWAYSLAYILLGSLLFSNFYPFT